MSSEWWVAVEPANEHKPRDGIKNAHTQETREQERERINNNIQNNIHNKVHMHVERNTLEHHKCNKVGGKHKKAKK